ncbi:Ribulose-phosphate 3-epimerase [Spironucleus salmonicida]|uniref:Ribulose-phosphate 3-epimerase n=1 Tax=Spironucleus salmonicida TaxID=348837 RepID=V6LVI9_9EUKA|nr:Ribulose-phosphate 3-epimerase [Spironucleus salmonicida]|eukprot:EST44824.1 Ribulose-phosphate 3-epimerase [Spironucleus salmonicida]
MIAPSILSADFANLQTDTLSVLPEADWIHFDVMDGHFVPNLTVGPCVLSSLKKQIPNAFYDVHLMVTDPQTWALEFIKAGADMITFHVESQSLRPDPTSTKPYPLKSDIPTITENSIILLKKLQKSCKAGVVIKPESDINDYKALLSHIDLLLIMSVEPGFGGQKYQPKCAEKAKLARELGYKGLIEIDGGISNETIQHAKGCGIDVFVAGSYVFGVSGEDRKRRILGLKDSQ